MDARARACRPRPSEALGWLQIAICYYAIIHIYIYIDIYIHIQPGEALGWQHSPESRGEGSDFKNPTGASSHPIRRFRLQQKMATFKIFQIMLTIQHQLIKENDNNNNNWNNK